jgi:hypothetical protein
MRVTLIGVVDNDGDKTLAGMKRDRCRDPSRSRTS